VFGGNNILSNKDTWCSASVIQIKEYFVLTLEEPKQKCY
jgi:hypothetical protein